MSIEQAFCNGLGDLDLSKDWPTATSRLWYIKRIRSLIVHHIHRTHTLCLKIQTAYFSMVSDIRTVKEFRKLEHFIFMACKLRQFDVNGW